MSKAYKPPRNPRSRSSRWFRANAAPHRSLRCAVPRSNRCAISYSSRKARRHRIEQSRGDVRLRFRSAGAGRPFRRAVPAQRTEDFAGPSIRDPAADSIQRARSGIDMPRQSRGHGSPAQKASHAQAGGAAHAAAIFSARSPGARRIATPSDAGSAFPASGCWSLVPHRLGCRRTAYSGRHRRPARRCCV